MTFNLTVIARPNTEVGAVEKEFTYRMRAESEHKARRAIINALYRGNFLVSRFVK